MDLLSAFKRKKPAADEGADSVPLARTRARQRLIGAAVLVVAGIIGFPLLFETEPRPLPVDVPIEIPARDSAVAPTPQAPPLARADSKPAPRSAPAHETVIDETAADEGREVEPPTAREPAAVAAALPASKTAAANDETPVKQAGAAPQAAAAKDVSAAQADAARAKALLEGKPVAAADAPSSAAGAPRFVVQVGAFTDPAAVKSTRAKVERLGLTTYTQVAQTSAGARTRVRVGPFATRAEAERAAARIKAADLPTVILAL